MKGKHRLKTILRKYLRQEKITFFSLWMILSVPLLHAEAIPATSAAEPAIFADTQAPGQALTDIHDLLFRANEAYLNDQYIESAKQYEASISQGHLNGHVFYNLGNCYIRQNQLGRAILNYKRASLLLPRDGDLKANLKYARSLIQDRIEDSPPSLWHTLAFWYFSMNFQELLFIFALFYTFFWISALFNLYRDSEWIKWGLALSLILSISLGVSTGIKYHETIYNTGGVILAREAPVRAGFSKKDTTLFVLHEGAEFSMLDEEKGWSKIALPDGKKGWLPTKTRGLVAMQYAKNRPAADKDQ